MRWELRDYETAEFFWEIVEGVVTFLSTGFGFECLVVLSGIAPGMGDKS